MLYLPNYFLNAWFVRSDIKSKLTMNIDPAFQHFIICWKTFSSPVSCLENFLHALPDLIIWWEHGWRERGRGVTEVEKKEFIYKPFLCLLTNNLLSWCLSHANIITSILSRGLCCERETTLLSTFGCFSCLPCKHLQSGRRSAAVRCL